MVFIQRIKARLIVEDEGSGFQRLEEWNDFNRKRTEYFQEKNFEEMEKFVSFIIEESDEQDSGNALFASLEYWNGGIVFNDRRNRVAVAKTFRQRRHGIKLVDGALRPIWAERVRKTRQQRVGARSPR